MAEVTSNVNNAGATPIRLVTTGASSGDQQVITQADGSTGALQSVNSDGSINTRPTSPATAAVTRLTSSATSAQAVAANTARRLLSVQVDASASTLYLLLGTGTASSTNCIVALNAGDYAEYAWSGAVQHVWSGTVGGANLTEVS